MNITLQADWVGFGFCPFFAHFFTSKNNSTFTFIPFFSITNHPFQSPPLTFFFHFLYSNGLCFQISVIHTMRPVFEFYPTPIIFHHQTLTSKRGSTSHHHVMTWNLPQTKLMVLPSVPIDDICKFLPRSILTIFRVLPFPHADVRVGFPEMNRMKHSRSPVIIFLFQIVC